MSAKQRHGCEKNRFVVCHPSCVAEFRFLGREEAQGACGGNGSHQSAYDYLCITYLVRHYAALEKAQYVAQDCKEATGNECSLLARSNVIQTLRL
jgi:hypothetical protein